MIVCSCNVFSDHQVRSVVAKEARRPWMKDRLAHPAALMRTQACTKMELIPSRTA
jgi:bacterioferritin-associated ferredoxin